MKYALLCIALACGGVPPKAPKYYADGGVEEPEVTEPEVTDPVDPAEPTPPEGCTDVRGNGATVCPPKRGNK